jgi:hypothetical protein
MKRSDIVREYGKPPYHGLRTLTRFSTTGKSDFQGPNSGLMKFDESLCQRCNDTRSQAFDAAWDVFTAYVADNEQRVVQDQRVDLAAVYGERWSEEALNLARYLVKHLICRIVQELPGPILLDCSLFEFLDGGPYPECLELDFCFDRGVFEMLRLTHSDPPPDDPGAAEVGFLSLQPLWVRRNEDTGEWHTPQGGLHYRWLAIYWKIDGPNGGENLRVRREIPLSPSDELFGPEVRELFSILADLPTEVRNQLGPDQPGPRRHPSGWVPRGGGRTGTGSTRVQSSN